MKNNLRYKYLSGTFLLIFAALAVVILCICVFYNKIIVGEYGEYAIEIAHSLRSVLDEDYILDCSSISMDDPEYENMSHMLSEFGTNFDGISSIYIFVPQGDDNVSCVIEMLYTPAQQAGQIDEDMPGDKYTFEEIGFVKAKDIINADMDYAVFETNSGKNGHLLTGYASLLNAEGHVSAIIAVSFNMSTINRIVMYYAGSLCGFIILTVAIVGIIKFRYTRISLLDVIQKTECDIKDCLDVNGKDALTINKNDSGNYKSFEKLVDELIAYSEDLKANVSEANEKLDECHRKETLLSLVQTEIINKLAIDNYEDDNIWYEGKVYNIDEFSGDFYDCSKISEGKYLIAFGSVMERNLIAALCMLLFKWIIKDNMQNGYMPDEVLDIANNKITTGNDFAIFTRVFLATYNREEHKLYYSSASGITAVIVRGDKQVIALKQDKDYMPVGAWEDTPYELSEIELISGDILVLYNRVSDYDNRLSAEVRSEKLAEIVRESNGAEGDLIENILSRIQKVLNRDDFEYSILVTKIK